MSEHARGVLTATLAVAVPLRIAELQARDEQARANRIRDWARSAVEPVASRGDILLYGGNRRGDVAVVFNDLARGLAALAHTPGGVHFAGMHWCLDHRMGAATQSLIEQEPVPPLVCRYGTRPRKASTPVEWRIPLPEYL